MAEHQTGDQPLTLAEEIARVMKQTALIPDIQNIQNIPRMGSLLDLRTISEWEASIKKNTQPPDPQMTVPLYGGTIEERLIRIEDRLSFHFSQPDTSKRDFELLFKDMAQLHEILIRLQTEILRLRSIAHDLADLKDIVNRSTPGL